MRVEMDPIGRKNPTRLSGKVIFEFDTFPVGKTVIELRALGMRLEDTIPDCAVCSLGDDGRYVFEWVDLDVVIAPKA